MPDVWTANPPKLRNIMLEAGAVCGKPPRVFKSRDPSGHVKWTAKGGFAMSTSIM